MQFIFAARFQPEEDGGFLVTFPDVPEAISQGDDLADARASAADALAVALRGRLADGRPFPEPAARGADLVDIPVDAETALKVAMIQAFGQAGISKSELARRLGKVESEARRILDPDHATKLPALQAALAALGKEIVVSVRDAA